MKDVLETIILNLVENKEEVKINEKVTDKNVVFEVTVSDKDMGRVIGRQGKIAKSIRTVIKAMALKEHKKVSVEFMG